MKLKNEIIDIDKSTGENTTRQKTYATKVKNTEEFYMTFIKSAGVMFGITLNNSYRVLIELCCRLSYNSNIVLVPTPIKKAICLKIDISHQAFANGISELKKLGILSGADGMYELNPNIVWKGTNDERNRFLKDNHLEIIYKFAPNKELDETENNSSGTA